MIAHKVRECASNEALTRKVVNLFIQTALTRFGEDETEDAYAPEIAQASLRVYEHILNTYYDMGIKRIFQSSESESEKTFLLSLMFTFLAGDPSGLVFTAPMEDAPTTIEEQRAYYRTILECDTELRQRTNGHKDFLTYTEFLQNSGHMTAEEAEHHKTQFLALHGLRFSHAIHMTMQAGFPQLRVNNRSIRVDLLAWIPSNPQYQIVVECDGFEYHSGKQAFIADRKRDRLLKASGYEVFRFSGPEIWGDPVQAGAEMYRVLQDKRDRESN